MAFWNSKICGVNLLPQNSATQPPRETVSKPVGLRDGQSDGQVDRQAVGQINRKENRLICRQTDIRTAFPSCLREKLNLSSVKSVSLKIYLWIIPWPSDRKVALMTPDPFDFDQTGREKIGAFIPKVCLCNRLVEYSFGSWFLIFLKNGYTSKIHD